ncbi:unnamed protein product [Bursaphelenchus xylophilus]|uniref:(pine wood nematode) hypothetical protein n=1 Tax=Bursaphelenchus xylophilus TaxID=6326 RepID=A0A1I7RUN3_BURXY|nr:unnamed protein product [Bursaphelenchus xylophilus]CAG9114254.1 unnamed protein product [Bursaphelenchus xylophilus]
MDTGSSSFELEFKAVQAENRDEKQKNIKAIEEFLKTAFQDVTKLVRLDVQKPQYVSEEDQRCVYKSACRCTKLNRHTPIDVVAIAQNLVRKLTDWSGTVRGMTATLVMGDKRLFYVPKQFQGSVDLYLGADELSLGNVIEHDKYIHHCILEKNETKDWFGPLSTMIKYYEADPLVQPLIKHRIMVDFEHDRRRMFVRFPSKGIGHTEKVEAITKLELRYSTIKRIFAQFNGDPEKPKTTLYFHLDTVPIVYQVKFEFFQKGQPNRKLDPKRRLYSLGDRQKFWTKNNFDDYVESPFFKLVLHPVEATRIMNILNRLVASTTKPIQFRDITHHPKYRGEKVFAKKFPHVNNDSAFLQAIKMDYPTIYLLEALASRGYQVKDRLHMEVAYMRAFKERIIGLFKTNKKGTGMIGEKRLKKSTIG